MTIKETGTNAICADCALFEKDCKGTNCQVWTGCVRKKPVDPAKVICKPRLIINEQDKGTDRAYNVQLWHSYDGGKNFYYAGYGRFFGDYYEAEAWRKAQRKNLAYDLMFGYLGNGVTVCNRAHEERGDYPVIAHIANCGAVSWYVDVATLPPYVLEDVNDHAAQQVESYKAAFLRLDRAAALDRLNDVLNVGQFISVFHEDRIAERSMEEIYETYIKYVCLKGKSTMPQQ